MNFSLRQTNIAKGVATLLLLFHHLFLNLSTRSTPREIISLFNIGNVSIEEVFASYAKVCVSIFVILSAYGLYKSSASKITNNHYIKSSALFVKNHLLKLMFSFWLIYIIFAGLGFFVGHNPIAALGDKPLVSFFADFTGFAYYLSTETLNPTWWFMGLIIVLYVLFPLLKKSLDKFYVLLLVITFLITFIPFNNTKISYNFVLYLWAFVLGMLIAKFNLFERFYSIITRQYQRVIISTICMLVCFIARYLLGENGRYADPYFAISIIVFCYFTLSKIPFLSGFLNQLGVYSGDIFMFHTFIYAIYFGDFIYSFKYPIIIYVVLLVICMAIAFVLDMIKKHLGINKLIKKLQIPKVKQIKTI